MLLNWQDGHLETADLSDSDGDDNEGNNDGEPVARYATEEQYDQYVPPPIPQLVDNTNHLCRRMKRIEDHHMSLSVTALFKDHQDLETSLRANVDGSFVTQVHHLTSPYSQYAYADNGPDVETGNESAGSRHKQDCERDTPISQANTQRQSWHSYSSQPVQGTAGSGAPYHSSIPNPPPTPGRI